MHPWLTKRGEDAVRRKHAAQGTEHEAEAARECSEILVAEHFDFFEKNATELNGGQAFIKELVIESAETHR